MTLNPNGFVLALDFGVPQIITARAGAVVSGGEIAYLMSGTSRVVDSGLTSLAVTDVIAATPASGVNFPVGVVMQNAGSNTACSIMVRGVAIVAASTALTCGDRVATVNGANAVDVITSGTNMPQLDFKQYFGRALTSAASGAFSLVAFDAL